MYMHSRIGAAVLAVTVMFAISPASAVGKNLTCTNTKTGAKKVVSAAKCPAGYSTKAPAKPASTKAPVGVTVSNAWLKALDTTMPMDGVFMTPAFMSITNISDRDATLVGGVAGWATLVQVHEVRNGKMTEKPGGLVIRAGYTEVLQAGGNHLMFMGMPNRVLAGDEVTFLLRFADGGQLKVTAPVKMTNAGSETYKPSM